MKHLLITLLALLTCATLHAQSVIVKATGAGAVHATGAGSVRGAIYPTTNTYCDGRFEIVSDNTDVVVDNDSGLTWTRSANIGGDTMNWTNSVNYCDNLETNGYSDWRLPSIAEFSRDGTHGATNGLLDAYPSTNNPALPLGHPFINVQIGYCNSSTESDPSDKNYIVYAPSGAVGDYAKYEPHFVWPCRGP